MYSFYFSNSKTAAAPIPVPIHIEVTPYRLLNDDIEEKEVIRLDKDDIHLLSCYCICII